jgi:hypothetical protein
VTRSIVIALGLALIINSGCTTQTPLKDSIKSSPPAVIPADLPQVCSGLIDAKELWQLIGDYRTLLPSNDFNRRGNGRCVLLSPRGPVFALTALYKGRGDTIGYEIKTHLGQKGHQVKGPAVAAPRDLAIYALVDTPLTMYLQLEVHDRGTSPIQVAAALNAALHADVNYRKKFPE